MPDPESCGSQSYGGYWLPASTAAWALSQAVSALAMARLVLPMRTWSAWSFAVGPLVPYFAHASMACRSTLAPAARSSGLAFSVSL